jgi:hypothetical protein
MSQEEVAGEKIMSTTRKLEQQAASSGVFRLRGELPICRLGFGAMRITGPGIWGERCQNSNSRLLRMIDECTCRVPGQAIADLTCFARP